MNYRADIDGLRAIAVALVLIFHGKLGLFPAGFIGVDIFFVISGYLITKIIIKSIETDRDPLRRFYIRRLWRLQPALIAVLLFTLLLATLAYLPDDFLRHVQSARYAAFLISNQYFGRTTTSYAAPDSDHLLLLHTWSLSIEWQWYLILPSGIWIIARYFPERASKLLVLGITLGSLVLMLVLSHKFYNKSYFFLSSRIFEFSAGACVVILKLDRLKTTRLLSSVLGLLALGALLYCATRDDILRGYPDYHAVVVSVASAVLIAIGNSTNGLASQALRFPPLVFVGLISYSLYLWHWPVFAAGRYLGIPEGWPFKATAFASTFALAYLSYVFIERPFRRVRMSLAKSLAILVVAPAILFYSISVVTKNNGGFPGRFGSDFSAASAALADFASARRPKCIDAEGTEPSGECVIGAPGASRSALLIGDSFSNHYWEFFDVMGRDANIEIRVQGTSSCLHLPGIVLFDWSEYKDKVYERCRNNVEGYYKYIELNRFDYVIIGQAWSNYSGDHVMNKPGDKRSVEDSRNRVTAAAIQAVEVILKSGAIPVIVKANYAMPVDFMKCFYQDVKLRGLYDDCPQRSNSRGADNEWSDQLIGLLKAKFPALIVIDPKDVQCSEKACTTVIDGIPVYRDVGHLTDYASRKFGEMYLQRIGNPFR